MKYRILTIIIVFIMLFSAGCTSKKGVAFAELVQDEVVKINMRHPGSGDLYSTTDEELINKFISKLEHGGGDYYEVDPVGMVGNSVYRLYNTENEEIATVRFYEKGRIGINNKTYSAKSDIKGSMNPFFEEFLNDANVVQKE